MEVPTPRGPPSPPTTTFTADLAVGSLAVAVAITGAVAIEAVDSIGGLIRGIIIGINSIRDNEGDS